MGGAASRRLAMKGAIGPDGAFYLECGDLSSLLPLASEPARSQETANSSGAYPVGYWMSAVRIPKDLAPNQPLRCTKNFSKARNTSPETFCESIPFGMSYLRADDQFRHLCVSLARWTSNLTPAVLCEDSG
jgi:hypothetical protein